jgi:predicted transcriptional regulator
MTTPLFVYNNVQTGLESIFRSRLQMQILLSLGEGCKTLSDLREITGSSSQALIPKIRVLEKRYFISANKYQYCLTSLGKVLETKIAEFTKLLSVLTHHDEFWKGHYLEGIPDQFINEMSDLHNSKIITDTSIEIFQVYSYYLKIIEEAGRIHWISSQVNPGHMQALTSRISDGIPVEMIVTPDVEAQLHKEPYRSSIKQIETCSTYYRYVTDDPLKLGVMISDKHLILGLYKEDMLTFDATSHFVSSDPQALSWGERLFTHFKSNYNNQCPH